MESHARGARRRLQPRRAAQALRWTSRIAMTLVLGLAACSEPRLNVVLITVDTLRADRLGIYGNSGGHSPNIDALAQQATVFENAVTPIGTTYPSHASMFTGLYPQHHGVRWNGDRLADHFSTLAEALAAKGYETAAFVSFSRMLTEGGLNQGFAALSDRPGGEASPRRRRGDKVNEMAVRWLDEHAAKPFFLWLHYTEPHSPYRLSSHARRAFAATNYNGHFFEGASTKGILALQQEISRSAVDRAALRVLYDGEVRNADRLVGEALAALGERGLLGETLIILASDHGEALGEHGDVLHGFLLWQEVIRVPLLIRDPRFSESRRVAERVSLIDLSPTILDLLELDVVAAAAPLDGVSLAAALAGTEPRPRRLLAEARELERNQDAQLGESPRVSVFDGNVKAVWSNGKLSCFDLERDSAELEPRACSELEGIRPAELEELVSVYLESGVESAPGELSDAALKELEALGYIR